MPPLDPQRVHDVVRLDKEGMTWRAIARALHVSRNTVRHIVTEHREERERPHSALPAPRAIVRASKLDPLRLHVEQLLVRYPDITAQRVFEILRGEKGYQGGDTIVKLLVRKLRPKPPPTPSLQTPPRVPADMGECDWSPYDVPFTHAPTQKLQAFGYTLRYSTRKYYGFFEGNGLHPLMDGHLHAFGRFGGAARRCTYDSQKPVVLRWEGHQPILNPRFIGFATYYEFAVVAVLNAPNRKPRVERSFWELVRSFFNGRTFRDRADLDAQLVQWMDTVADLRPIKRMKRRTRLELFAEEQPLLRPLPRHPYDTARVLYKLCDIEGFIVWESNRYSLPYEYVTELLPVRVTETELLVYKADLSCLARHALLPRGAQRDSILPGHRPRHADRGPDLDQLRVAFAQLDERATAFLAALEKAQPRSAGYHARQVLALRESWGCEDLVAALEHAVAYGALEYRAVERILQARGTPRRLEQYVARRAAEKLNSESATGARDLSEYDELPVQGAVPAAPRGAAQPCPSEETSAAPPPKTSSEGGSGGT
jgi:transposase